MSLLASIRGPEDVKALAPEQLPLLAQEIRERLVSVTAIIMALPETMEVPVSGSTAINCSAIALAGVPASSPFARTEVRRSSAVPITERMVMPALSSRSSSPPAATKSATSAQPGSHSDQSIMDSTESKPAGIAAPEPTRVAPLCAPAT